MSDSDRVATVVRGGEGVGLAISRRLGEEGWHVVPADRTALVTGAAHGIGLAVARRLAGDGWRVVAVDRAESCGIQGIRQVQADVSNEAAVMALVEGIRSREGRLDALVSNAGMMVRKRLRDLTFADWSSVIGSNLSATYLLARAAEDMLRASKGSIVTIGSTRAHMSEPDTESYAASKGGLVALTHALAISMGPAVRANVVSPGWIDVRNEALSEADHKQHPAGRVGRPEDVAGLVSWLLSAESGFVTGSEFMIDGGMSRKMIYSE